MGTITVKCCYALLDGYYNSKMLLQLDGDYYSKMLLCTAWSDGDYYSKILSCTAWSDGDYLQPRQAPHIREGDKSSEDGMWMPM